MAFHIIAGNINMETDLENCNDNFSIVHLHRNKLIGPIKPTYQYIFEIYQSDDITVSDNDNSNEYVERIHKTESLSDALIEIATDISEMDYDNLHEEDPYSDITVISCCNDSINAKITGYINNIFSSLDSELICLDIFHTLNVKNTEELVKSLKNTLGTKFIYEYDPVAFSYAVYMSLNGGRL